jgi:hypothetical protein
MISIMLSARSVSRWPRTCCTIRSPSSLSSAIEPASSVLRSSAMPVMWPEIAFTSPATMAKPRRESPARAA